MSQTAYLYGQILGTHSFWLKDGFLKPDEYSEISEKYFLPGGETGTAATVLASLEVQVKMDGTHIFNNCMLPGQSAGMSRGKRISQHVRLRRLILFFRRKHRRQQSFV